jgi:hypothetical protein
MQGYEGCLFSGPFSQLLTVLNQIDWRIEPPFCGIMMVVVLTFVMGILICWMNCCMMRGFNKWHGK